MSTWSDIADAWVDELIEIDGLVDAIQHRYAPWSVEALQANAGERHLAVWPVAEAEQSQPFTTDMSLLATQTWNVLVWEDASTDSARLQDDEQANADWLALHEEIRARFLAQSNVRLGSSNIVSTRYDGCEFGLQGSVRVIAVRFLVTLGLAAS